MMAQALCALQYNLANGLISPLSLSNGEDCYIAGKKRLKRKRATSNEVKRLVYPFSYVKAQALGNFPSPKELASLNEDILREHCNLGYRASHILQFARKTENGKLRKIDENCVSAEICYGELMKIKGFGPFACANIMMCIGVYQKVPEDTETIRHLKEVHSMENCSKTTVGAIIEQVYMKYAPFQCLAYWLELLDYYENKFGKLSELPNSSYGTVTGSRIYMDGL